MSLIYSLIARDDQVLVEFTTASGNFQQISRNILRKITPGTKLSYSYNSNYFFHYINESSFTYLCMADSNFSKRIAFSYLENIKDKFLNKFPTEQLNRAIAFSLNQNFSDVLKEEMEYYTKNQDDDKLKKLQKNLNEVKEIMVENIDKILEREEKIDILVTKTKTMTNLSTTLKKQAVQVRRTAYWKNVKVKIAIVIFLLVLIYVILALACQGFALDNCVN